MVNFTIHKILFMSFELIIKIARTAPFATCVRMRPGLKSSCLFLGLRLKRATGNLVLKDILRATHLTLHTQQVTEVAALHGVLNLNCRQEKS